MALTSIDDVLKNIHNNTRISKEALLAIYSAYDGSYQQAKDLRVANEAKNLTIWSANEKTDPAHTKKVNQRGGFTAIDAYHQIRNATAYFGPVGQGWGWDVTRSYAESGVFIVSNRFWYRDNEHDRCEFDVFGSATLVNKDGRADDDAPKKALTDSITKGLSYLGFNSDVFLGKFDDNKYIATRTAEVKEEKRIPPDQDDLDTVDLFLENLKEAQTKEQVDACRAEYSDRAKLIAAKNMDLAVKMKAAVEAAIKRVTSCPI